MKPKPLLVFALLVVLTGCSPRPAAIPGLQTPPGAGDGPGRSSNSDVTPYAAEPDQKPPGTAVGVRVWAVDMAGKQKFEIMYENQQPLLLVGISPNARYWLFDKTGLVMGDPHVAYLLDRDTGALTQGPEVDMHPAKVVWSGHGFWVNDLVHLSLDLQVEQYTKLRQAVGLGQDRRVIAASYTADGSHVALVVDNWQLNPSETRADLFLAEAEGKVLSRSDRAVQPFCYDGKAGPFVHAVLSPGGDRLALMSQSPGDLLIDTAALGPDRWRPVAAALTPPVPLAKSTCGPGSSHPVWSPDGSLVWIPGKGVVDRDGSQVSKVPLHSLWALWTPDGARLVVSAEAGSPLLRLVSLDGQSRDISVPDWTQPIAFLPDGRLLVARTIYP